MDYSKQRKDLITQIIEMHNFFMIEWNKSFGHSLNEEHIWNRELIDIKFERYILVEESSHNGEDFDVKIKVRYTFRSEEARKFGERHQYFYDKFKETVAFSYKEIDDIKQWKKDYLKIIEETLSKHETN